MLSALVVVQAFCAVWAERQGETTTDFEAALKANNKTYTLYIYDGTQHGFHNDTTPRYDENAAKLAWQRTVDFFNKTLRA
jgi:carboxymethylenebutenolidase